MDRTTKLAPLLGLCQSFTMADENVESKTSGKCFEELYDMDREVSYESYVCYLMWVGKV